MDDFKLSEPMGDAGAQNHTALSQDEKNWGSKGAPDNLPIRAARIDGGVIIAWNGLHTSEHIEARINDVLVSL